MNSRQGKATLSGKDAAGSDQAIVINIEQSNEPERNDRLGILMKSNTFGENAFYFALKNERWTYLEQLLHHKPKSREKTEIPSISQKVCVEIH